MISDKSHKTKTTIKMKMINLKTSLLSVNIHTSILFVSCVPTVQCHWFIYTFHTYIHGMQSKTIRLVYEKLTKHVHFLIILPPSWTFLTCHAMVKRLRVFLICDEFHFTY